MTRLAFDMSSYIKTAMLTGTDTKDGRSVIFEDKPMVVNSAEYGYEIVINMMIKTLRDCSVKPIDCLLVFEGMNSKSRRLLIDSGYKGKRDKRPPEFYEEFHKLKDRVEKVWLDMGAIALQQDYVEADDVLAYLAEHAEEDLIIATRDGDLGKLNTEPNTVNQYGATVVTYIDGLMGMVKFGGELFVHPFRYITLYKALVGDTSDNIPGVTGFGPAKFQKLAETYGYDGLDELMGLMEQGKLEPLHEMASETKGGTSKDKDKPTHPLVKMIVDQEAAAIKSWKLARLYPEWVTFHRPTAKAHLQFRPGKVALATGTEDARLAQWYGNEYLVTSAEYDDACEMLRAQLAVSPDVDFDIETSTPDESDDWLQALGDPDGVDQLGSVLTGFSVTFGENKQHTFYVSVDHRDTANITKRQAREMMEIIWDAKKENVIQNTFFELTVLYQMFDEDGTLWRDHWEKYGFHGLIPNVLDTKLEANYVNENIKTGLKFRSKHHLGYEQTSYEVTVSKTGHPDELPTGGKVVKVVETQYICAGCQSKGFEPSRMNCRCTFCDGTEGGGSLVKKEIDAWNLEHPVDEGVHIPVVVTKRYKMKELTAEEVVEYGCDDTICTGSLHRFYKLVMQLEHQYHVYLRTEIMPSYQHAKNFVDGIDFSLEKMRELEKIDTETFDEAWVTVRAFLMENGWEGTVPPTYGSDITPAQIKEAYKIVVLGDGKNELVIEDLGGGDDEEDQAGEPAESEGEEDAPKDPFLATRVRTPSKLVALLRDLGHETFAGMVEECIAGNHEKFTAWVREYFTGEPLFAISNKQMQKLLYEVMKLPIKVRNKPTEKMRKEGREGNPKGDALAIAYAIMDGTPEQKVVLESLKLMSMVKTRRSLYYSKYPYFIHWKTGKIHPTHNQCHTNTRRASESKPNKQQLPKHAKIVGQEARYRETIVPHHPDAVIVSLDFDSQELRVIADYSKDSNMVACFVGDNKKGMHSLTGHSIATKKRKVPVEMTYEEFDKAAKDKNHPLYNVCSEYRALGKKVNFTTEFGAMAPKLAITMLVPEDEAQTYIDAKEAMFPGVRAWKTATIEESKREGIVRTKTGAVRHLAAAYMGEDYWLKSKAERQAVNFKVQSSSAEMTKLSEGRVWERALVFKYNAVCYGPVHDEVVFSVMKTDLLPFLEEAHWCMTQPYGDMVIPIESSISFGPSFGQQAEIGLRPTKEAVIEGYKQIAKAWNKEAVAA